MFSPVRRQGSRIWRRWRRTLDTDPVHDIVKADLFDLEYYRAQVPDEAGSLRGLRDAVHHYVSAGRDAGLAFHPLIELEWWAGRDRTASGAGRRAEERSFIDGAVRGATTSPVLGEFDLGGAETRDFIGRLMAEGAQVRLANGLTVAEARSAVVAAVRDLAAAPPNHGTRSGVDWQKAASDVDMRVEGRVSVIVPTYEDWQMTIDAVRSVLASTEAYDIEILVIDNGSRPSVHRLLISALLGEPRVRVIRCDQNTNFAGGMNRGIADSTGQYIVLLNNDAVVTAGWLDPLLDVLSDPRVRGVQPLLMFPESGRIQAAGTIFLGEGVLPWHFLAGHPYEDALRIAEPAFHAVTAAVMVLRARDMVQARGFDEEYANGYEDVDLCLRLLVEESDHFRVVTESIAFHAEGSSPGRSAHDSANRVRFFQRWSGRLPASEAWRYSDIGLRLDALDPLWFSDEVPIMITAPHVRRPQRLVEAGPAAGRRSLRWVLCLTDGHTVADAEVASLIDVLRRLGQEVVTVRAGVHASDGLDDVLVSFSRDAPLTPRAAAFNVLVGGGLTETSEVWDAGLPSAADGLDSATRERRLLALIDEASAARAARFAQTPPARPGLHESDAER